MIKIQDVVEDRNNDDSTVKYFKPVDRDFMEFSSYLVGFMLWGSPTRIFRPLSIMPKERD